MAEIDREIALFQKADRRRILEEQLQKKRETWDIRKKITYTLDILIDGIKKGTQYLYALKLEFEEKTVFNGKFKIPFIKNFFDVMQETADEIIFVSNKRKVTCMMRSITCQEPKEIERWSEETAEGLKKAGLRVGEYRAQSVNQMKYFCFEVPTAAGDSYNLSFCLKKGLQIYTGVLNCLGEDKDGMGLLLEALILVTEEWNR